MAVKLLRLKSGEDIVAEHIQGKLGQDITIENPAMLMPMSDGRGSQVQVGLAPWMPFSAEKRFSKWLRSAKIKNLEYVKEYYGYNNEKASQALDILDDEQIEHIKRIINRGGKHGRIGVDSRFNARGDVE